MALFPLSPLSRGEGAQKELVMTDKPTNQSSEQASDESNDPLRKALVKTGERDWTPYLIAGAVIAIIFITLIIFAN